MSPIFPGVWLTRTIPSRTTTRSTKSTLEVPGRHRLERSRRQRGQVRLDQSDRGRRSRRRALPGQLDRRENRWRARRLSFRLLVPPADGGDNFFEQNAPVEDDALPPVLDVEATPTSKTCHRHLTQESAAVDMRVMLQEMERHYGKRPIIYTTVDFTRPFYRAAPSPTIRSGSGPPNTILRSSMDRERGRSGSISPTGRRPVSMAPSIATSSMARRSSGTHSSASSPRACGSPPYSRLWPSNWRSRTSRRPPSLEEQAGGQPAGRGGV